MLHRSTDDPAKGVGMGRADFDPVLARAAALIVAEDAETHDADEQVEREIVAMREALRLTPSTTAPETPH